MSVVAEIDITDRIDPDDQTNDQTNGIRVDVAPDREILTGGLFGRSHTDKWINFPWSCDGPVAAVGNRDA